MAKNPVRFCVVNAFTDSAFKGNPAAVCLLEEERDEEWLQAVAREFSTPITCYLTWVTDSGDSLSNFRIRWFTKVREVRISGHATLAASYFLLAYDLVESSTIEFLSLSGILMAKRVSASSKSQNSNATADSFLIELDFPVIPIKEYNGDIEISSICKSLNVSSVNEIYETTTEAELFVVLPSAEAVVEVEPNFDEIRKFPGKGICVTGLAPTGSGFDFFSRFFAPKMEVNEEHVCGSAHCALAPYWSKKIGKHDFIAYQASPRSGILILHVDKKNQRVLLRGKAVAVMEDSLLL